MLRVAPQMTGRLTLLIHPSMTAILARVIEMFAGGFNSAGIETTVREEPPRTPGERVIMFGANFFATSELLHLSRNSIAFNVENVESQFMTDEYLQVLRNFHVWDYSAANAGKLSVRLGRPVQYAKLFYVGGLSRISHLAEKDIDVLFYGSFNPRRQAVLDGLHARGLRVEAVFEVFGADLDALIARAKVVINIHFYDNGHLEVIRLFDLLANRCAVVSELNAGEAIDSDLVEAMVVVPYDHLIDATEALVRDAGRRCTIAVDGFETFSRRTPNELLPQLLAAGEGPMVPCNAIVGSGKAYDPAALNIDINDDWQPDIVADISDTQLFTREFPSRRFGKVRLQRGWFYTLRASHVLEHLRDLITAMTNSLELLADGGTFHIAVPYDLSYGAWQDPTHVRAFNERSWLYYCEWHWYLGWDQARFELAAINYLYSDVGRALSARGVPTDDILRSPRAVDEMHVVLRKRQLTEEECLYGRRLRGYERRAGWPHQT